MSAIRAVPSRDPAPPAAETLASRALALVKTPGKTWVKAPGMNLGDREFLAPALEILETPPSPVHVAFLWIICALVVTALAWAYFGRVDIIAAAQGKFQPMGQVKVVEPLETGRVEDIRVSNGSAGAGGRCAGRTRPLGGLGRRGRRARGARVCAGGNPAPQDRALKRPVASLRRRAGYRLAGGCRARVARAREPGSRRRSRTIGRDRRRV